MKFFEVLLLNEISEVFRFMQGSQFHFSSFGDLKVNCLAHGHENPIFLAQETLLSPIYPRDATVSLRNHCSSHYFIQTQTSQTGLPLN